MVPWILTHDQKNAGFTLHLIFYATQRCLIGPLPVKKRGVFNTTRKQNNGACNGKQNSPRSQVKTMLVCFFNHKGIVPYEFIAQGQTVNQQCYLGVLKGYGNLFRGKDLILYHDNAPVHDALTVREFLAKNSITKTDHPPYSPDLAHCDFWLFPKLKNALKGQRFIDLSDIQHNVKTLLRGIPKNDFQDCFRQWHHHVMNCTASQRLFWRQQQPLVHS